MKKAFFALMVSCLYLHAAYAQHDISNRHWLVTAGPVLALPNKFLHDFHSFGVGADIAAIHPIAGGFAIGGRANYTYFFGKQTSSTYVGASSHYDATHLLNLLADISYMFESKLSVGVDLGLGASLTHATANASFARIIYVAYQVSMKKPVVFGLYFDQTNFQKNFGFRVGFSI